MLKQTKAQNLTQMAKTAISFYSFCYYSPLSAVNYLLRTQPNPHQFTQSQIINKILEIERSGK